MHHERRFWSAGQPTSAAQALQQVQHGLSRLPFGAEEGLNGGQSHARTGQNGWQARGAGAAPGHPATGAVTLPSDELRDGFRRAVGDIPVRRLSQAEPINGEGSISSVFPRVASWGNLSTHSSGSGAGLYSGALQEPASRGLATFEPLTTPAGMFSSNRSSETAGFPSYLASIWSDDKTLSGSPNNHFAQPSLLNNHS